MGTLNNAIAGIESWWNTPTVPTAALIGAGSAVAGAAVGAGAVLYAKGRTRRSKSRAQVRKRAHKRIKGKRYSPHTAGKRKDTSTRRIRYTSKGQPYVIKADGRARFIKMKSARTSHKKRGGRY